MVARKFKVDDREPLPAVAAPLPPAETGEELALLALSSIRGVGYWTLSRMAKAGIGFAAFLETSNSADASRALKSFGAKLENKMAGEWQTVRDRALARATRLIEDLRATGTRVVMATSPQVPRALDDLSDPPAWLFVQGDLPLLSKPSVAVVGTRAPTDDGLWLCRFVGLCLESWGAPTVSGLAVGIDHIVHELSLRAKVPTIAVLGTGIFSDYPKGAVALRERILGAGGAIRLEGGSIAAVGQHALVHRIQWRYALQAIRGCDGTRARAAWMEDTRGNLRRQYSRRYENGRERQAVVPQRTLARQGKPLRLSIQFAFGCGTI